MLNQIDNLKARLDQHRPLPPALVSNLRENLILNWTFHSNAIEGNTLTLKETRVALEGITVGGKTLREHFEAINHRDAILLLEEQVQQQSPVTERLIKSLHLRVLKNIDADNAGRYRSTNVLIAGATHRPPTALQVPQLMEQFITGLQQQAHSLHPVELAARAHADLVKIHPFTDGNGRTSRLLMNLILLQAGLPAAVIKVEQRLEYYSALDKAHTAGDHQDFIELVGRCVEEGFEPYWWGLGIGMA